MYSIYMKDRDGISVQYSFLDTRFGNCLVASTDIGICAVGFYDTKKEALIDLYTRFPKECCIFAIKDIHQSVRGYIESNAEVPALHLIGTPFQHSVWKILRTIPKGEVVTYGDIAEKLGDKKLTRAVANAVGKNPIGYIIPCHRVVRSGGALGGFHWGIEKKKKMLTFEGLNV